MLHERTNQRAMSAAANHNSHFFHPIHTTASEDLWQLPHHSTGSDLDHYGENQQLHRSWSSEEVVVLASETISQPPTTILLLNETSSRRQARSRQEDDPPRRCPLGERTNTLKRYV